MNDLKIGWDNETAWNLMMLVAMDRKADEKTHTMAQAVVSHLGSRKGGSQEELLAASRALSDLASRVLDESNAIVLTVRDGAQLACFERLLRTKPIPTTFKELER